ncbi:MAG: DUF1634 domain-containing protein [Acidobacteria bacterium]|nr:MAG: DUF1634 domain-containing protein [Acidobacteriota bacterium]
MPIQQEWTDQKIEQIVGNLLRAGVLLSAVVVLCGGVLYLIQYGHAPADYRVFRGEPTDLKSVSGILRAAFALDSRGIIQLGLLLLIATPVARVAFSIFGFAKEKDRMYVAFTVIVLLILLYSLIGSASGG